MTPGLKHATITKYILGGLIVNSTIASCINVKHLFHIQVYPHLSTHLQLWRLLIWQFAYANAGEVLFGSLALYSMREVERQMGSKRFAAFATIVFGASSIIAPALAVFLHLVTGGYINHINSGLTPTLFAILYQYHALIPAAYTLQLSSILGSNGVALTNKAFLYALTGLLAVSSLPGSFVAAGTGWLVGAMYDANVLPKLWRLPAILNNYIDAKAVSTTIRTTPVVQEFQPRTQLQGMAMGDVIGTLAGTNERPDLAPPAESDIQLLMSMMSITRDEAIQNLSAANNSIERAAENMLLG